jgi:hypothetical protein
VPPGQEGTRNKLIFLSNLPENANPEKLAALLNSENLVFHESKVHLDEETKNCKNGGGSISFKTKDDCTQLT